MSDNKGLHNLLVYGGAGLGAFGLSYLGMKRFGDMLSFSIPKLVFGGIRGDKLILLMDIDINNPSILAPKITLQTSKAFYQDTEVGHISQKEIKLESKSTKKIENIEAEINIKSLGIVGLSLLTTPTTDFLKTVLPRLRFEIFCKFFIVPITRTLSFGSQANQIGIVAAGRRNIKDGSQYDYLIKKPEGTTREVQKYGNVEDTVKWAGFVVKKYYKDVENLARYLDDKSDTKKELFKNIFDFCYNHIQYHLDRPGVEELRRPAMVWKDRVYGVDCDDFTMFIASILHNLSIPFEFRITKYNGKHNYQHIYLIVPVENGQHITIDPVLDRFNYEKPFSDHKDYTMKSLSLAGTDGLGIPIEILAGTDDLNDVQKAKNMDNLYKVVYGYDLQGMVNGLGGVEDDSKAMLRYLKRLRNVYATNPNFISEYQSPKQLVQMLDYAIKYWHTDKRSAALDKLAKIEDELIDQGQINLKGIDDDDDGGWEVDTQFTGSEPELSGFEYKYPDELIQWEDDLDYTGSELELSGFEYRYYEPEWEEDYSFSGTESEDANYIYDYGVNGLNGRGRRRRKEKKAKRRAKRSVKKTARRAKRKSKGGIFKQLSKGAKKGFKKVVKGLVKISATPMRLPFLTAIKVNAGGISEKLKYAYLTEQQAIAQGMDVNEFKKLKKAHAKVEKMFLNMGGSQKALKRAILSGKRKSLRGFENVGGVISGLSEQDGWEQDLDYTGNEPESPQNEYKYDSQVWRVDKQFSGVETESANYEYDYSFDGLDGGRLRFRKRRRPKRRWLKRNLKNRRNHTKRTHSEMMRTSQNKGAETTQKTKYHEFAGELLERIQDELKTVNYKGLIEKSAIKREYLELLAQNVGNISSILSYGMMSKEDAVKLGVSVSDYQKLQKAVSVAQDSVIEYGGKKIEVYNAILLGKDKAGLEGLGDLGVVTAAAGAAAGIIGKIVGWLKDIKVKKQAKKDVKTAFKTAGNSNADWRQSGRTMFNEQWAEANKQTLTPESESGTAEAPVSKLNIANLIKNSLKENISTVLPSDVNPQELTVDPNPPGDDMGFWDKHKKKVIAGSGVLILGAASYAIYRQVQKKDQNTKSLSGIKDKKKAKPAKAPAKRKASSAKIKAVTLS